MPLLFALPPYDSLGNELCQKEGIQKGVFSIHRFSNQELHLEIESSVQNETCFLLASITPPEEHLFSFLLLSDTLKKEGAARCIGWLPYLAYTRYEKKERGKSEATRWIGNLCQASGLDAIWTLDIHSSSVAKLFKIPVHSCSTTALFYETIQKEGWKPDVIIAPDEGAKQRCEEMAKLLHLPVAVLHKRRDQQGVVHREIEGKIGKKALVIDDILDTGATLISCLNLIRAKGAEEIKVMVSHVLCPEKNWEKLLDCQVYCTNSVQPILSSRHVISILPAINLQIP